MYKNKKGSGEVIADIPELLLLYKTHEVSIPWSPERNDLIQTFSSQQSFTPTGILESPPRSKADTGTYMQNKGWTYSVGRLHFKNVAPNLLLEQSEIHN